jgi:hypothetical protein
MLFIILFEDCFCRVYCPQNNRNMPLVLQGFKTWYLALREHVCRYEDVRNEGPRHFALLRGAGRTHDELCLGNVHLEDLEGDGRITLRCILGRQVVTVRDGWNSLGIVPIDKPWYYQRCWTLDFCYYGISYYYYYYYY